MAHVEGELREIHLDIGVILVPAPKRGDGKAVPLMPRAA
jgi:hypothetical protein